MLQALPPPPPPQETIVVTAPALPEPVASRAYHVETIGPDELRNAPSTQLDEVLKDIPGLQLFRRSDARSAHPTSQGVTLRALGGNASSRALLILDGVPQSDPFGGWINWPAYDPAALAEVRIMRGGGSVAYGPGALAGTIEMESRLASGTDAALYAGSRDSAEARINAGTRLGGTFVTVSGRAARGDGFIPVTADTRGSADRPASYAEANARVHLVTPVGAATDVQVSFSGFRDRRERGLAFTGNRTDGADASVRMVHKGDWGWSALAYTQWREFESSFASVNDDRSLAERVALQDEVPSRSIGGRVELRPPIAPGIELRIGADARHSSGESRELYSFVNRDPTRRRRAGGETLSTGLFGEAGWSLGAISLSAGARIDHWRISDGKLVERLIATGASLRDERYDTRSGWLPTGRAGAALDLGEGLRVRSAAYLGWRLPTLNELFRPFRAGPDATAANAALDPERLAGAEAGIGYDRSGLSLALTAFANRLTDPVANVTIASGPGVFPGVGFVGAAGQYRQRRNLDAIHVRGVEASAEGHRGPWSFRLGYSFADARVAADGVAAALDGLRPAQTPRHVATAGLGWRVLDRSVFLTLRRIGAQFEDDLNQQLLPAATTLDASANWPLSRRVDLSLRGENLLNKRVIAGISGDGAIERATPRTLWLGLRFSSRGAGL